MIPTVAPCWSKTVPHEASFWVPRADEIGEEGFGWFRDTWYVGRARVRDVRSLLAAEETLIDIVDRLSEDADSHEELAAAIESLGTDSLPEWISEEDRRAVEAAYAFDGMFGGLELGVAGLVYALNAVPGVRTAASCRGHSGAAAWSAGPVVLLAADKPRCDRLAELLPDSGCGFAIDGSRPELISIMGRSIRDTHRLAERVTDNIPTFRESRQSVRRRRRPGSDQPALFELK